MAISIIKNNMNSTSGGSVDIGTGSNRIVVFFANTASGSDSVTAVTIGSLSLSKVGSKQSGTARFITMWAGYPTQTGSQTLTITGTFAWSNVLVYDGVNQSGQPGNFASSTGAQNGGTITQLVTAGLTSWIVGCSIYNVGSTVASTNTTARDNTQTSVETDDSNGIASPVSLNWTLQTGSNGDWAIIAASLDPSTNIASSPRRALLGVGL